MLADPSLSDVSSYNNTLRVDVLTNIRTARRCWKSYPGHPALHQTIMANHAEYTAVLAAMGNLLLERGKKLKEMQ